jgi:hypothetical protein
VKGRGVLFAQGLMSEGDGWGGKSSRGQGVVLVQVWLVEVRGGEVKEAVGTSDEPTRARSSYNEGEGGIGREGSTPTPAVPSFLETLLMPF